MGYLVHERGTDRLAGRVPCTQAHQTTPQFGLKTSHRAHTILLSRLDYIEAIAFLTVLRFTGFDTLEGYMKKCFNCSIEHPNLDKIFCPDCEQKDRREMFPNGLRKEQENFYDKV